MTMPEMGGSSSTLLSQKGETMAPNASLLGTSGSRLFRYNQAGLFGGISSSGIIDSRPGLMYRVLGMAYRADSTHRIHKAQFPGKTAKIGALMLVRCNLHDTVTVTTLLMMTRLG